MITPKNPIGPAMQVAITNEAIQNKIPMTISF